MKLLEKMKNSQDTLTNSDLIINNYIYDNANNIANLTATLIANECFLTTTTVNRFCKKLGCDSFTEFKIYLIKEIENEKLILQPEEIDENILHLKEKLDTTSFTYIIGFGSSYISALYLFRQLTYLNYKCTILQDPFQLEFLDIDTIIVLSSSGESRQMMNMVNLIDASKIISITRKSSALCNHSNICVSHNVTTKILNPIEREQQMHLIELVNTICKYLYNTSKIEKM